jgi:hypothetical protein
MKAFISQWQVMLALAGSIAAFSVAAAPASAAGPTAAQLASAGVDVRPRPGGEPAPLPKPWFRAPGRRADATRLPRLRRKWRHVPGNGASDPLRPLPRTALQRHANGAIRVHPPRTWLLRLPPLRPSVVNRAPCSGRPRALLRSRPFRAAQRVLRMWRERPAPSETPMHAIPSAPGFV